MANLIFRGATAPTVVNTAGNKGLPLTNDEIDKNLFALNVGPTIGTTTISPGTTSLTLAGLTSVTATSFIGTTGTFSGDISTTGIALTHATAAAVAATTSAATLTVSTLTATIANGDSGAITIKSGNGLGSGDSGAISIATGVGGASANGNSGSVTIKTGNGTTSVGALNIFTGDGVSTGAINIYPGNSTYAGVDFSANVSITGGSSTGNGATINAGNVIIKGGANTAVAGVGGNVTINGGNGNTTKGSVTIGSTNTSAVAIGTSTITTTVNGTVKLPNVGTSGFVKLGTGGQLSQDTTSYLSGTVPIGNGGTNITTYAAGDILYASEANVLSKLAKGSDGQVLKLASGFPAWGADIDTDTVTALSANNTNATFVSGNISFTGGGAASVTRVGNAFTISSTDTDTNTNTTYSHAAASGTGGANLSLVAGGSGSGTDNVLFKSDGATTVSYVDADTIQISSPSAGDGTLTIATKSASLTNTDVTLNLSGAYSANTSTNRTINAVVGPALTNLATFMTTATAGFIRRSAQDTYAVDTSTYLTSYTDTLSSVTGRGASTTVASTFSGGLITGTVSSSQQTLTNQNGNSLSLVGSNGGPAGVITAGGSGGGVYIAGGIGTGAGYGGSITIAGGIPASGGTGSGGGVLIKGGTSSASTTLASNSGQVDIRGGDTAASQQRGGDVDIRGGMGNGTTSYSTVWILTAIGGSSDTTHVPLTVAKFSAGSVYFPNLGASGFVKLSTGGLLVRDTTTYATGSGTASGTNTGDQTLPTTLPHNGTALSATTGTFTTGKVSMTGTDGILNAAELTLKSAPTSFSSIRLFTSDPVNGFYGYRAAIQAGVDGGFGHGLDFWTGDYIAASIVDRKLGIRTTNPQKPLHVTGDVRFEAFSSSNDVIQEFVTTAGTQSIKAGANANTLAFATNSIQRAYFSAAGGFSVGTNTDAGVNNILAAGNVTALSDARVKTNIVKIANALDKVEQLNGYTFDRTDMEGPRQTGVIAQEVIKVLPEAVLGSEDTTYSVAYGNMMGLMIEAIKELNAKVTDLQNQLNNK